MPFTARRFCYQLTSWVQSLLWSTVGHPVRQLHCATAALILAAGGPAAFGPCVPWIVACLYIGYHLIYFGVEPCPVEKSSSRRYFPRNCTHDYFQTGPADFQISPG